MILKCDHTSVGILVYRSGRLLLIERKKPPYGFAPPSGHVDDRGSFEEAATAELLEEVGLATTGLALIREGRKENPCRRPGGTWHYWKIYRADTIGASRPSASEVLSLFWSSPNQLRGLAKRTKKYNRGEISEDSWRRQPGLEPVWLDWLEDIGDLPD